MILTPRTICFCLILVSHWSFAQQQMVISFTNRTSQSSPLVTIRKITFSNGNLKVTSTSGSNQDYSLNTIKNIRFGTSILTTEKEEWEANMYVFPNPTAGDLKLSLTQPLDESFLCSLTNVSGQILFENISVPPGMDGTIDLSPYFSSSTCNTGMYCLTATIHNKTYHFKILKY